MTPRRSTNLLLLAPIAWIVVALVHPMGDWNAYDGLHDKVALWTGIHFAQLALSLAVAALLWILLQGAEGLAARAARVALPIYLVSFAAFDSVTGIGSGLVIKHANGASGGDRTAAGDAAHYLATNRFSADLSPLHVIATSAFVIAVLGTAHTLRNAGFPRRAWLPLGLGVLLAMHAGPGAAVGAAALAVGAWFALTSRRSSDAANTVPEDDRSGEPGVLDQVVEGGASDG